MKRWITKNHQEVKRGEEKETMKENRENKKLYH